MCADPLRLEGTRHQPIQPIKDWAIDGTEGQSLLQLSTLNIKLMTKDQDLGPQRSPRPEQQHQPDQTASFSYKAETLRDLASRASEIRFPAGTGGICLLKPPKGVAVIDALTEFVPDEVFKNVGTCGIDW